MQSYSDAQEPMSDRQLHCIQEDANESYVSTFISQKQLHSAYDDMESVQSMVNRIDGNGQTQNMAVIRFQKLNTESSKSLHEEKGKEAPLRSKFAQRLIEQENTKTKPARWAPKQFAPLPREKYSQSTSPNTFQNKIV